MAKKLTVEVDAETSKAKRKIQGLAESGGASAGADVSPAADRAARELDKAAKSTRAFGEAAASSSNSMKTLIRSFAGVGVGMAANYAAGFMDPGVGKTSMGYLSSIASGASMGATLGSLVPGVGTTAGAIIGSAAGAGKEWLDNSNKEESWFKDFRKQEHNLKETREWADYFNELTSVKTHFKGIDGIDELKAQLESVQQASGRTAEVIERLKQAEADHINSLNRIEKQEGLTADERIDMAAKESAALAFTRTKLAQSEGASKRFAVMIEALEDQIEEGSKKPEARASMDALDSLARVGGNFAGSDAGFRDLQRVNEKQVALLEKIEAKTGKGAGKF